jgi:CPA2 family monovalent cation:H+ antiporter-2
MALGAFLAGLMLAETEFRHEVEVTIEPFKSLLLGLFFFSVGMQTDMRLLLSAPILLPLSVLGLMLIKAIVLAPLLRMGGLSWGSAVEGSFMMGQAGEFAFIIATDAAARGLFPQELAQFVLLGVALSMFATPLAARLGHRLGHAWKCKHHDGAPLSQARVASMKDHVIIVGFGRMGQLVAEVLAAQNVRYVAIDIDLMRSTKRHPLGEPVYFGDVSRPELLHRVHASSAAAIVLTMDHPEAALHAASTIRREFSEVPLLARAHDEYHARALSEAGATMVMPEALEAGLQLTFFVLQAIGIEGTRAAEAIRRERENRLAMAR